MRSVIATAEGQYRATSSVVCKSRGKKKEKELYSDKKEDNAEEEDEGGECRLDSNNFKERDDGGEEIPGEIEPGLMNTLDSEGLPPAPHPLTAGGEGRRLGGLLRDALWDAAWRLEHRAVLEEEKESFDEMLRDQRNCRLRP